MFGGSNQWSNEGDFFDYNESSKNEDYFSNWQGEDNLFSETPISNKPNKNKPLLDIIEKYGDKRIFSLCNIFTKEFTNGLTAKEALEHKDKDKSFLLIWLNI